MPKKKKKAKKAGATYLPPLIFDSSGSAMIRFAGALAVIDVHWAKFGTKVNQSKLLCAGVDQDADGMLAKTPVIQACRACKNGVPKAERAVAVGWDVSQSRWCIFIGARKIFTEAFAKSKPYGVCKEDMEAGDGLNVILQRVNYNTLVEVVPDSLGTSPQGDDDPPDLDVIVDKLKKKSLWRHYDTPQSLGDAYGDLDDVINHASQASLYSAAAASDIDQFIDQPKQVAKAEDKKKNDKHVNLDDGSDLVIRNRWELF